MGDVVAGKILFVVGGASSSSLRRLVRISTHLEIYSYSTVPYRNGRRMLRAWFRLCRHEATCERPLLPTPVTEGIWFGQRTIIQEVDRETTAFGSGTHAIFCEFEIATTRMTWKDDYICVYTVIQCGRE
jgi:hypothetical protein